MATLKKAEYLSEKYGQNKELNKLYSLTMNNLGCYYIRISKPNVALNYMKKALKNDVESGQPASYISSTKLNICAVLSELNRHDQAIIFASSAISDLKTTLRVLKNKSLNTALDQQS